MYGQRSTSLCVHVTAIHMGMLCPDAPAAVRGREAIPAAVRGRAAIPACPEHKDPRAPILGESGDFPPSGTNMVLCMSWS